MIGPCGWRDCLNDSEVCVAVDVPPRGGDMASPGALRVCTDLAFCGHHAQAASHHPAHREAVIARVRGTFHDALDWDRAAPVLLVLTPATLGGAEMAGGQDQTGRAA